MNGKKRKEMYVLLLIIMAYIAAIVIVVNYLATFYFDLVTRYFGQTSSVTIDVGDDEDIDTEYYKLDYTSTDELVADEREYAERVQAEGVILLQNNGLPVEAGTVTFLGLYSRDDMLSGGVSVSTNAPTMRNQFGEAGFEVNTTMIDYYAGVSSEPLPSQFSSAAAASVQRYNDLAVVVLFSGGAESVDITVNDLRFDETEQELVRYASENFEEVVVLLNTSNTVELGIFEQYDNLSVLYTNFSGDAGIGIIPQIITGEITPSGKTADTFAYNVESPIAMLNYQTTSDDQNIMDGSTKVGNYVNYVEGIYVGYRYFETRYEDFVMGTGNAGDFDYDELVQYPFGFGLSYTTFEYSDFTMTEDDDSFTISVTVRNSGTEYSGKEAVGIYMQSPYTEHDKTNGVEKASVELVGFAKTEELTPQTSQTLTIEVDKKNMRAYDSNYNDGEGSYIVDDGTYYFTVGANSHDAINNILAAKGYDTSDGMTENGNSSLVETYEQEEFDVETYSYGADGNRITNQFEDVDMNYYYDNITYVSRNNWMGTIPTSKAGDIQATSELIADFNPTFESSGEEAPTTGADNGLSFATMMGVDYDNEYWDLFLDQFTAEELMSMVAYGGFQTYRVTGVISKPQSTDKDGPAGLDASQLGGETCYTFPSDSMFACTWNKELIEEYGYFISQDCLLTGTTGWYAPACNIHRVSICGRTREYFSEDPYLSGVMSYAIAFSAQENGVVTYTKHFALNEQENNRSTVCMFANEQAIREIYLEPFEMAVEDGGSMGIMTSMNRVGTVYSSSDYGLCTAVLKNEWGFEGVVITDFVSGPSSKVVPREMVLAGTDLFLCTASDTSMFIDNYANDADVLNALRESTHRICYAYVNSNLMNGLTSSTRVVDVTPPWIYWMVAVDAVVLYGIYIAVLSPIIFKKQNKEEKANVAAQ